MPSWPCHSYPFTILVTSTNSCSLVIATTHRFPAQLQHSLTTTFVSSIMKILSPTSLVLFNLATQAFSAAVFAPGGIQLARREANVDARGQLEVSQVPKATILLAWLRVDVGISQFKRVVRPRTYSGNPPKPPKPAPKASKCPKPVTITLGKKTITVTDYKYKTKVVTYVSYYAIWTSICKITVLIFTTMFSKCNQTPKTKTKFHTVYATVVCIPWAPADPPLTVQHTCVQ